MVDSISPKHSNNIEDLKSGQLGQSAAIEKILPDAAQAQKAGVTSPNADGYDISDEAYAKLAAERQASKFVELITKQAEEFDTEKVSYFKNLVENGTLDEYFSKVSDSDLASTLLQRPGKAGLL